jgi:hypothetical protein
MTFDKSILRPGDTLLYYERSLVDWIIGVKTSGRVGHIEIYTGEGMSVASRNGIGVNRYALRLDGLVAVRRPFPHVNLTAAENWFERSARGQGYDFLGLLSFWLAVKRGSPDRMFCSEFALRFYRKAFFQPFNPDQDADRTSPFDFWKCGTFETVLQKDTKI